MPVDESALHDKEVAEAIAAEIKALGESTAKNYDELRRSYHDLKARLDAGLKDTADKTITEKLALATAELQQKLDFQSAQIKTAIDEKVAAFELAQKRLGEGRTVSEAEQKAYDTFVMEAMSVRGKGNTDEDRALFASQVKTAEFKQYLDLYGRYLRKGNDHLTAFNEAERKALSVGVDPHGGYTVTPAMSARIITRLFEIDPLRQLANVENISTSELDYLADQAEAGYGWEGETQTGAETDTPTFGMKKIQVFTMYAKPKATQTLLDDAAVNVENWVANKIGDRLGRAEGAAFMTGDGIKKPRGLLTIPNGTTYDKIEQVNMGHATALTADGFVRVKYSLIEQFLNNGTWLMNRLTVAAAIMLKNGDGDYIWKPGLAGDAQSTILGMPVRMSPSMPAVAANALSVMIGDYREGYTIVDRMGISVQRDPFTKKPFVEFYARKRVGGDLVNGQAIKIGVIAA